MWSLREEPSERNMSRRGTLFRSYLLDFLYDLEDIREVLLRVPGRCLEIAFFKIFRARLCNYVGHKKRSYCLDERTYFPVGSPLPSGEYANIIV